MLTPGAGDTTADAIGKVARGLNGGPLTFLRHLGDDDAYHRGPNPGGVLFVVPGIWTGMPPQLLATVRARRACSVTGRCLNCDTCVELAAGTFAHEPGCPVADDQLRPALARWGRQVGTYARGRRIRETPGVAA